MAPFSVKPTDGAAQAALQAARASAPKQQHIVANNRGEHAMNAKEATIQARRPDEKQHSPKTTLQSPARIRMDETGRKPVVQILDEKKQVVRQYPPEELLKIASRFRRLQGLLFDERR